MTDIHAFAFVPGTNEAGLATMDDAQRAKVISRFDRRALLCQMSFEGTLLSQPESLRSLQEPLIQKYFDKRAQGLLRRDMAMQSSRGQIPVALHKGSFRKLVRLAWHHAPEEGGLPPTEPEHNHAIGQVLMSLQDEPGATVWAPKVLGNPLCLLSDALNLHQNATVSHYEEIRLLPVKEAIVQSLLGKEKIAKAFETTYGISIWEIYAGLQVLANCTSAGVRASALHPGTILLNPRENFHAFGIRSEVGEFLLKKHVQSWRRDMGSHPVHPHAGWENDPNDYGFMVQKPYMWYDDDNLFCLDEGFSRMLFARAAWKYLEGCTPEIENLGGLAGEAFQKEFLRLLKLIKSERSKAKVVSNQIGYYEVDGIYQEEALTAVFECKSGMVPDSLKRASHPEGLATHIGEKYIFGTPHGRMGVSQIVERIKRLVSKPKEFNLRNPKILLPVLVVEDDFLCSPLVSAYIRLVSGDLFKQFSLTVMPLVVLHCTDIRWAAARCKSIGLGDIIYRYVSKGENFSVSFGLWLSRAFPVAETDPVPAVSPDLPGGFLQHMNEHLTKAFTLPKGPECQECNYTLSLWGEHDQARWFCSECGQLGELATPEERAAHAKQRDDAVKKYWQS